MSAENTGSPIFVLCCARSGSTLLRHILDAHPDICCPPELHLLAMAIRLKWVYRHTSTVTDSNGDDLDIAATSRTRADIDRIMEEYARFRGKSIWSEKSVFTIDMIQSDDRLFPDARYVCVYRNGPDVVRSALDVLENNPSGNRFAFEPYLARSPGQPIPALVEYWSQKTAAVLKFEKSHGSCCVRIRFEDLVLRAEETIRHLFRSLKVTAADDIIDRVFAEQTVAGPNDPKFMQTRGILKDRIGRGTDLDLSAIHPRQLERVNQLHAALGYDVIERRHPEFKADGHLH